MTKSLAALAAALMLASACGDDSPTAPTPNTGPLVFTAQLSAANEVPPVVNAEANARGVVTITMNVVRDPATGVVTGPGTATFTGQVTGLPEGSRVTRAGIYRAIAGSNGAVVLDTGISATNPIALPTGAGPIAISGIVLTQALATEIAANAAGFHVNLHTPLNPDGVARGQLAR